MTPASVREYAEAMRLRYLPATRAEKGKLLSEFCLTTAFHRKAAIRLLRQSQSAPRRRPGRQAQYDSTVARALHTVWQASDHLCSKRLKPFLPELVDALECHDELALTPEVRRQRSPDDFGVDGPLRLQGPAGYRLASGSRLVTGER